MIFGSMEGVQVTDNGRNVPEVPQAVEQVPREMQHLVSDLKCTNCQKFRTFLISDNYILDVRNSKRYFRTFAGLIFLLSLTLFRGSGGLNTS